MYFCFFHRALARELARSDLQGGVVGINANTAFSAGPGCGALRVSNLLTVLASCLVLAGSW
jgi:hypothetical protein